MELKTRTMSLEEARKRLRRINRIRYTDRYAATSEEAALYIDALEAIADGGCDDPALLASVVLEAQLIDFTRVEPE